MNKIDKFHYSVPSTDQGLEVGLSPLICIRECWPALWSDHDCYVEIDEEEACRLQLSTDWIIKKDKIIRQYETFIEDPNIWRILDRGILPAKYFKKNFITLYELRRNKINQIL
jgi:hypothetical protein